MSGADILTRILEAARPRLAARQAACPLPVMIDKARHVDVQGGFGAALGGPHDGPLGVIAELKRASPSAGVIRAAFDPEELAGSLAAAGASALSVLTEPDFFEGADESVAAARRGAGRLPLLRKDFLVDPWQIWESRRLGADAVLLIATVLPDQQLATLLSTAVEADLDALVEVKNEAELARAVAAGARIIGVNARDLSDFSVDLSRAERLVRRMPAGVVRVGESGVSGPGDLRRLAQAGFDAALVGTSLMVTARPGRTLRGWLAAGAREQRR